MTVAEWAAKSALPTLLLYEKIKGLVSIPVPLDFWDSDSNSSKKWNDSGIDSDSGIGIMATGSQTDTT